MSTAFPPVKWKQLHPSPHPTQRQLYYKPESCLKKSRLVAHQGSMCRLRHSWQPYKWNMLPESLHCCLNTLQASNPEDTFALICKAYTVIHLWCYGCKKRFMTHNKLLRSCMWWGNRRGGNGVEILFFMPHWFILQWEKPSHYAHLI